MRNTIIFRIVFLAAGAATLSSTSYAQANDEAQDRIDVDLSAMGAFANGKNLDGFSDDDKSGAIYRAAIGWDHFNGPDLFALDISTAYVAYKDPDRGDRWNNRIAVTYGRDIARDLTLDARVDYATETSALEYSNVDQASVRGRISYHPGQHRLRASAGWRWRDYNDTDGTKGNGFGSEVEYRYRTGRGSYFQIETRYDQIDADIARRSYDRVILAGEYHFEPVNNLAVEIGGQARWWEYSDRFVGSEKKNDRYLAPELRLEYGLGHNWFVNASGTVIVRRSNDPDYDETITRGTIGISKRFNLMGSRND